MSSWTGIFGTHSNMQNRSPWAYMDSVEQFQKAAESFKMAAADASYFKMADDSNFKMAADNSSDSSDLDSDEEDEETYFRTKPSYWNLAYGQSSLGNKGSLDIADAKTSGQGGEESGQPGFGEGSLEHWDPESMENELAGFEDVQTVLGRTNLVQSTTDAPPEKPGTSLSSDSLAFTLVYCSVFMVTLLYIGFRLARKWRKSGRSRTDEHLGARASTSHAGLTCNHAVCHQAAAAAASINTSGNGGSQTAAVFPHVLPYTGLGALWIPEIMSMETPSSGLHPPPPVHSVHSRGQCNAAAECDNCQRLAQPPPSYTKLFLEEQPPTYSDAVVLEAAVVDETPLTATTGGIAKLQPLPPTTIDGKPSEAETSLNIPTETLLPTVLQQSVSITNETRPTSHSTSVHETVQSLGSENELLLEASAPQDLQAK